MKKGIVVWVFALMAVANAMAQPVGWDASAKAYADLFNSMTTA